MCWLEELEEETVKFIWSLHEMECTDEMISEAVKKPVRLRAGCFEKRCTSIKN